MIKEDKRALQNTNTLYNTPIAEVTLNVTDLTWESVLLRSPS